MFTRDKGKALGGMRQSITANGPVGTPGSPIPEAVADPQPSQPAAPPTIPPAMSAGEGVAEAAEVRTEEKRE